MPNKNQNNIIQNVFYLGEPGSFSFVAAKKYFKDNRKLIGIDTFSDTFKRVKKEPESLAVLPLENTTTGIIPEVLDLLIDYNLKLCGEINLCIHHHLLGQKKMEVKKLKRCISHPQALLQCSHFLDKNKQLKIIFSKATSEAAKKINSSTDCIIAGQQVAKLYNLKFIKKNIENDKTNQTRFVVLSNKANKEGDKISLLFSVKHVPGSLFKALKAYSDHNLNLTKIESRPFFGRPFEYVFLIDLELNSKNQDIAKVLKDIKKNVSFLTIFGRYNLGETYEA